MMMTEERTYSLTWDQSHVQGLTSTVSTISQTPPISQIISITSITNITSTYQYHQYHQCYYHQYHQYHQYLKVWSRSIMKEQLRDRFPGITSIFQTFLSIFFYFCIDVCHLQLFSNIFITFMIWILSSSSSSVSTVTRLRAGWMGFDSGRSWDSFSSPPHPDRLWAPLSLLPYGYRSFFPGGKATGAWSWPLTSI
jgi:hypothetical protein